VALGVPLMLSRIRVGAMELAVEGISVPLGMSASFPACRFARPGYDISVEASINKAHSSISMFDTATTSNPEAQARRPQEVLIFAYMEGWGAVRAKLCAIARYQ